jgi:serine/threonine-protein kinase
LCLAPALARAEGSASDKAAAEALFDEARELAKAGHYAEACPKLEESQRLDAGIGTLLYLADCYEKTRRLASAWATFREASAAARAAGQSDREAKAIAHAKELEPRVAKVIIQVSAANDMPGPEVRRDGRALGRALWGSPIPMDPGMHQIEVSAPGRKSPAV